MKSDEHDIVGSGPSKSFSGIVETNVAESGNGRICVSRESENADSIRSDFKKSVEEDAKKLVEDIQQESHAKSRAAEALMVKKYQKPLMLALSRKSNRDIAEEIAQETWRIVIEKVRNRKIDHPEKLAAFILQIGRNQLYMYFRRNKLSGYESSIEEEGFDAGPLELYEREQSRAWVRELLNQLNTKRDKEVLTRYYLKDEERQEICQDFDMTEVRFSKVLSRAKERLRSIVKKQT